MSVRNKLIKKLIARQMAGWSDGTLGEQRAKRARMSAYIRLPADIHIHPLDVAGIRAAWIYPPEASSGVILYLHGGAYALSSIEVHQEFIARLGRAAKMRCLAIDYRLAPEHPFPAALEDAAAAYRWLQTQEYDPARIIIAGDSSGGGLALGVLLALREAGDPLPAGTICISPWTDLALTGASVLSKAKLDPILDRASLQKYAGYYASDQDLTNPLVSPLYGELEGLPPLLFHVGADEILLDDSVRLAQKARTAGVGVTLQVWDEMFHGFQLIPFLPETRRLVANSAAFVSQNILADD